jgi:hypothetical protein
MTRESLDKEWVVVVEHDQLARIRTKPVRIVSRRAHLGLDLEIVGPTDVSVVQDETGIGNPVMNPTSVGAFETTLCRPRIEPPGTVAGSFGTLRTLPLVRRDRQDSLHERGLNPLPSTRDLARA